MKLWLLGTGTPTPSLTRACSGYLIQAGDDHIVFDHGFGAYHGPIVVNLDLRVDGEEGGASFDVVYTPAPPARFTGKVREALEGGSVCLYVQLSIDKPGRYVIVGRVDDADGKGFAYLDHNELLQAGAQEAKMCIFGKLILDEHAKSPFALRDVEGSVDAQRDAPLSCCRDDEMVGGLEGLRRDPKA